MVMEVSDIAARDCRSFSKRDTKSTVMTVDHARTGMRVATATECLRYAVTRDVMHRQRRVKDFHRAGTEHISSSIYIQTAADGHTLTCQIFEVWYSTSSSMKRPRPRRFSSARRVDV